MQTATITITEEAYQARQDALIALPTAALKKGCRSIARELAQAERSLETGQVSGEDAYALQCLRDFAGEQLEGRRNGYTGKYEA